MMIAAGKTMSYTGIPTHLYVYKRKWSLVGWTLQFLVSVCQYRKWGKPSKSRIWKVGIEKDMEGNSGHKLTMNNKSAHPCTRD